MSESIALEVVYALPDQTWRVTVQVPVGCSLQNAVSHSGIQKLLPPSAAWTHLGVFGRIRDPQSLVQAGDQIELYRPLQADPKQARRQRAAKRSKTKA